MADKKKSVLIVDDEQTVCDVLYEGLSERGYLCTAVQNGSDALAQLAKDSFDVALLDIRMPGMSGMDLLREIWLNHKNTAVIMITAIDDTATAVSAMQLGAGDYIVKPFDLDRVHSSICAALWAQQASQKPSTEIDAIAHGVETNLDPFSAFAKVVTERTVGIARRMGIAEDEIKRWTSAKIGADSKKDKPGK